MMLIVCLVMFKQNMNNILEVIQCSRMVLICLPQGDNEQICFQRTRVLAFMRPRKTKGENILPFSNTYISYKL